MPTGSGRTKEIPVRPKLVLSTCAIAVAIALTACGDDDSDNSPIASATDDNSSTTGNGEAASNAVVQIGETDLGEVLTTADGFTLYAFTNDTAGVSTCEADCADAWPPLLVDSEALPEGLDPAVFAVVPRNDGTFQLSANDQPLYRFAGDAAPGDTNGQGSGGVWFAVGSDGQLIQGDAASADADTDAGTDSVPEAEESNEEEPGYGY